MNKLGLFIGLCIIISSIVYANAGKDFILCVFLSVIGIITTFLNVVKLQGEK